jgi:hypothetical protein
MKQQEKIKIIKSSRSAVKPRGKNKLLQIFKFRGDIARRIAEQGSKIFVRLVAAFIVIFLFLNLFYSQYISPLYLQFVNNDKNATVTFLEKIKTLPDFQKILKMNRDVYGKTIEEEIFRQDNKNITTINNLEQILTNNLKARDILYSLYELNLAEGNKIKAVEYLRQAKEIDPAIK